MIGMFRTPPPPPGKEDDIVPSSEMAEGEGHRI